jgi:preprotein translocase subunit YajC
VIEAALMVVQAPQQGTSRTFVFVLNIVMVIAIFYFLLIRPQRKEQERHEQMIAGVDKGDEIVTAGGIVGKVIRVEERQVIIKTAGDTKITVERSKIARKIEAAGEERHGGSKDRN